LDSLTRAQVLEIDAAFDEFAGDEEQQRAAKRRKTDSGITSKGDIKSKGKAKAQDDDTQMGGGFILEDDEAADAMGGGFIPEEEDDDDAGPSIPSVGRKSNDTAVKPGYILLESIPKALELLDLDGDDPSVLSIFENASEEDDGGNSIVKRKSFMRVTAILVAQRDEDKELESKSKKASTGKKVHSGGGRRRAVRLDVDEDMDEHDDSDPLVLSSDEEDEEDPDNEDSDPWADEDGLDGAFGKGREPSPASTRRTTRSVADSSKLASLPSGSSPPAAASSSKAKGKGKSRADEAVPERKLRLSSKQEEECERMFQQFFQSTDKSKNRSISIEEIRYVATLLNEKLSDADVGISAATKGPDETDFRLAGCRDAGVRDEYEG
jgi:hypothetical protein